MKTNKCEYNGENLKTMHLTIQILSQQFCWNPESYGVNCKHSSRILRRGGIWNLASKDISFPPDHLLHNVCTIKWPGISQACNVMEICISLDPRYQAKSYLYFTLFCLAGYTSSLQGSALSAVVNIWLNQTDWGQKLIAELTSDETDHLVNWLIRTNNKRSVVKMNQSDGRGLLVD